MAECVYCGVDDGRYEEGGGVHICDECRSEGHSKEKYYDKMEDLRGWRYDESELYDW